MSLYTVSTFPDSVLHLTTKKPPNEGTILPQDKKVNSDLIHVNLKV